MSLSVHYSTRMEENMRKLGLATVAGAMMLAFAMTHAPPSMAQCITGTNAGLSAINPGPPVLPEAIALADQAPVGQATATESTFLGQIPWASEAIAPLAGNMAKSAVVPTSITTPRGGATGQVMVRLPTTTQADSAVHQLGAEGFIGPPSALQHGAAIVGNAPFTKIALVGQMAYAG